MLALRLSIIIKYCAQGIVLLKLTTDRHKALRSFSATADLFVHLHSTPQLWGPRRNIAMTFCIEKLELWFYQTVKTV